MKPKNFFPYLYGFDIQNNKTYLAQPYFDLVKEQEHIGNLIQNLDPSEKKKEVLYAYTQEKFFRNAKVAACNTNKRFCKAESYQNDFAYYTCLYQKKAPLLTLQEMLFTILLLSILIKIISNVLRENSSVTYIRPQSEISSRFKEV